ncbi:hypothetical protein SbBS512_A0151 (plasmid) [Shigella boydii CDC 3083-94]|uniref:Uncharacterized protein n=1 Tax=Shigella boydii serotype 18 (strain CDC 3083-94 / BS512) TaxID=344609 RepID=B2TSW8_SHIB3|nr:hypothetical protein SbBS512_A0151 [Shigella boydii CDC 3083-94]
MKELEYFGAGGITNDITEYKFSYIGRISCVGRRNVSLEISELPQGMIECLNI